MTRDQAKTGRTEDEKKTENKIELAEPASLSVERRRRTRVLFEVGVEDQDRRPRAFPLSPGRRTKSQKICVGGREFSIDTTGPALEGRVFLSLHETRETTTVPVDEKGMDAKHSFAV